MARERKSLAALFLNRGGYGIHARRQHGKGREFEKLREYIPGDGFDEIHWKATAKRRHPITKVFQIERTQEVYLVIDTSRLSTRPAAATGGPGADDPAISSLSDSRLERFITAALVVGLAARRQGDLFGVLTFSDSVHDFLRAQGGKSHYGACRDHIFNLRPRMVNPDYEELATFIRLKLRRRALIMILTSLDDPALAESFIRAIDLTCRRHLVMVTLIGRGRRITLKGRLRRVAPELVTLLGGLAVMLVWAGIVEAFFSQYHEPVIPYHAKITFGVMELIAVILFFGLSGKTKENSHAKGVTPFTSRHPRESPLPSCSPDPWPDSRRGSSTLPASL
jgi:hypothetical protein